MNPNATRHAVVVLAAAALPVFSVQAASLDASAKQMFDDLGVVGNITTPQAFTGQTLNTYTGGTLFIRSPTRTYQLVSAAAPYIKSGCGGIDVFGGSFSHIASAEFKNMLKNITSALPAVVFQLLLKSVEPLFGTTVEWLKDAESFVNRANISSCEAAQAIVGTGASMMGFSSTKTCEGIATRLGIASDVDEAKTRCESSSDVDSVLTAGAANPATADMLPFEGNLVWESLRRWLHLDDADRELIMSLTGTTIYPRASDGNPEPQFFPPTIRSIPDLLYGNTDAGSAVPLGQVKVKLLKCGSYPDCTTVTEQINVMPSLAVRVIGIMRSLSTKIATASGAPTVLERNFVNSVPLPVYRLLAASNAVNNTSIAEAKINQYADYVAVEFAQALLARAARMGVDAGHLNARFDTTQREQLRLHQANAAQLLTTLATERQAAELRAQSFIAFASDVAQLERTMRANMPQQLADLMGYSGLAVGR